MNSLSSWQSIFVFSWNAVWFGPHLCARGHGRDPLVMHYCDLAQTNLRLWCSSQWLGSSSDRSFSPSRKSCDDPLRKMQFREKQQDGRRIYPMEYPRMYSYTWTTQMSPACLEDSCSGNLGEMHASHLVAVEISNELNKYYIKSE